MSSNDNFKLYIDEFFDNLILYDDINNGHHYKDFIKATIDNFLENENSYNAYEVYEAFFMIYQITGEDKSETSNGSITLDDEPNTLLELVKMMKSYEENTGDLIDKQRDHFIHSVNVFLLGLAIYSQNSNYRQVFKDYVYDSPYKKYYRFKKENSKKEEMSNEEFFYRWGIASLFHDIGYPVEIIGKQLKTFVNKSVKSISNSYDVDMAIDFKDFERFNSIEKIDPKFIDKFRATYPETNFLNLYRPTDIMAHKISLDFAVDIDMLLNHLDNFVDYMSSNGFIDHGFFSSIFVLNSYGSLIQKFERKDQDFFFYPIVDSATAILLHNYYRNSLKAEPFGLEQLDPMDSPLAFMLILCDELQEWNRKPFGTKDKKRNHANDLNITISEKELKVKYILKSGSLGFGFNQDKESLLRDLLAIDVVFDEGCSVSNRIELEKVIKEIEEREVQPPYVLMKDIEEIARSCHEVYVAHQKDKGEEVEYENFDDMPPEYKLSNIRLAKSIPTKLKMIGCEIAFESDEREEDIMTEKDVLTLSILEHKRWCKEKENAGWEYGKIRNDKTKKNPSLVEWKKLPKSEKDKDKDFIEQMPEILRGLGLKIVTSKLKLLTLAKHDYYNEVVNGKEFNDLDADIRFSNYRQTERLVENITELDYKVVSIEQKGEEVLSLSSKEVNFLAQKEHESWYKDMVNLGWRHGRRKSIIKHTNPNLVEWDKLNNKVKRLNKRTLEHLPVLCKAVGLKIIKNK